MAYWDPPIAETPEPVRKPKKTVTGRVVYDRPWHNFTLRDGTRILNKMYISFDDWEVGYPFLQACSRVFIQLGKRLFELALMWGDWKVWTWKQAMKIIIGEILNLWGQQQLTDVQRKCFDLVSSNYRGM